MGYQRVLPRDLFNESKLLKCLGQLHMMIHDWKCQWRCEHDTTVHAGFNIDQDQSDGSFYATNLIFRAKGVVVSVRSPLNSTSPYPAFFIWGGAEYPLFNDDGTFSDEYREFFS